MNKICYHVYACGGVVKCTFKTDKTFENQRELSTFLISQLSHLMVGRTESEHMWLSGTEVQAIEVLDFIYDIDTSNPVSHDLLAN